MVNLQMSHYILLATQAIFTAIIRPLYNLLTYRFGKTFHTGNGGRKPR